MRRFLITTILATAVVLTGCEDGDTGPQGPGGATGPVGADGSDGSDGLNSLIRQDALAIGDANCPNSGTAINSGLDSNSNQLLEDSEILETTFTCVTPRSSVTSAELSTSLSNPFFVNGQAKVEQIKRIVDEIAADGSVVQSASAEKSSGLGVSFASGAPVRSAAKNVILFIGDGMGVSTVTAARILDGQDEGLPGEENQLSFGRFPFSGLAKTYNVDAQTPDSAGTMTAMVTGVKTDVGTIGYDEDVVRGTCEATRENEMVTALELAELAGMSTGVVSTARITHATPAATYAKSADRNWEDISDMPQAAIDAGCEDIASQLVNFEANMEAKFSGRDVDGIEVIMGGGRRHFLPRDASFNSPDARSSVEGDRTDGRDLTAEWQMTYPAGEYIIDQAGFDALDIESADKVFALFNESHMQYEQDRANDVAGEPSIADMTAAAIARLDNDPDGFFLTVESGRIDHAHHAGNAHGALRDTIAFSQAIQAAVDATDPEETLIIVTADHGHVMTLGGYPQRGNPILGKVVRVGATEPALASDDLPYTTVAYSNGRGFRDLMDNTNSDASYGLPIRTGRVDLTNVDTLAPGFHQEALIPQTAETHSGEDVGIYAIGPGAELVTGTHEQNAIFHIMDASARLVKKAE